MNLLSVSIQKKKVAEQNFMRKQYTKQQNNGP